MVTPVPKILFRQLPTRKDGLQHNAVLHLETGHEIHVPFDPDDQDALAWISLGVDGLQDIEQIPLLDVENYSLKGNPAFAFQLFVFLRIPEERFHGVKILHCVPLVNIQAQRLGDLPTLSGNRSFGNG